MDGEVGGVARVGPGAGTGGWVGVGDVFASRERCRERGKFGWGGEEVEGAIEDWTG